MKKDERDKLTWGFGFEGDGWYVTCGNCTGWSVGVIGYYIFGVPGRANRAETTVAARRREDFLRVIRGAGDLPLFRAVFVPASRLGA